MSAARVIIDKNPVHVIWCGIILAGGGGGGAIVGSQCCGGWGVELYVLVGHDEGVGCDAAAAPLTAVAMAG